MTLAGVLERFPGITWILAHAGGFLPYIAWRVSLANLLPHYAAKVPGGVLDNIRKFHFDTALSPSPYALAALRELVDPRQILFGSDFPFAPAPLTGMQVDALQSTPFLSDLDCDGVYRSNAMRLFPQFGSGKEERFAMHASGDVSLRLRARKLVSASDFTIASRIRRR